MNQKKDSEKPMVVYIKVVHVGNMNYITSKNHLAVKLGVPMKSSELKSFPDKFKPVHKVYTKPEVFTQLELHSNEFVAECEVPVKAEKLHINHYTLKVSEMEIKRILPKN